jgi:hypothetical protein
LFFMVGNYSGLWKYWEVAYFGEVKSTSTYQLTSNIQIHVTPCLHIPYCTHTSMYTCTHMDTLPILYLPCCFLQVPSCREFSIGTAPDEASLRNRSPAAPCEQEGECFLCPWPRAAAE